MGLLDHQELMIVKGVPRKYFDNTGFESYEQDPVTVNLLDTATGFSLVEWSPSIPSLKGGGLWADSSINDGRTLITGAETNVIETIVVQLTGATLQAYAAHFSSLERMVKDGRAFGDTFYQIEPVYLRWWAAGAPGPQFALIYNIDIAVDFQDGPAAQARITLTIEREFGWRGIAPGDTPLKWTLYWRGITFDPAQGFNEYGLSPGDVPGSLIQAASMTNYTAYDANNVVCATPSYIDIPAGDVPGDLPALLQLSVADVLFGANARLMSFYVSRWTRPVVNPANTLSHRNTLPIRNDGINNGVRSTLGTDATFQNDTGTYRNGAANCATNLNGTNSRLNVSFATATDQVRLTWGLDSTNLFRGRYMAFLRCYQSGGALGETLAYLQFGYEGTEISLTERAPKIQAVASPSPIWPLLYMGVVTIPVGNERLVVSDDNSAPVFSTTAAEFNIRLRARRTGGVGQLYVADLVLMPIDEMAAKISNARQAIALGAGYDIDRFAIDSTGLFLNGQADTFGASYKVFAPKVRPEISGQYQLTLLPKINNRLYFLYTGATVASLPLEDNLCGIHDPTAGGNSQNGIAVAGNIVPRWSGIRDA